MPGAPRQGVLIPANGPAGVGESGGGVGQQCHDSGQGEDQDRDGHTSRVCHPVHLPFRQLA